MKVKFQIINHYKKDDGWFVLLIPSFVIGHFKEDQSIELGIFWLFWAIGFHLCFKSQKRIV